jgi:hypothetical protein
MLDQECTSRNWASQYPHVDDHSSYLTPPTLSSSLVTGTPIYQSSPVAQVDQTASNQREPSTLINLAHSIHIPDLTRSTQSSTVNVNPSDHPSATAGQSKDTQPTSSVKQLPSPDDPDRTNEHDTQPEVIRTPLLIGHGRAAETINIVG